MGCTDELVYSMASLKFFEHQVVKECAGIPNDYYLASYIEEIATLLGASPQMTFRRATVVSLP